ncbi:hypothetical protein BDK92_0070 [Micromonospora pisi]|uniref:Ankyrin n=1 Tax=Micromonospora pisi TaxID=589240 RepID=A0A495JCR6_9ACTN|nr:hypothetical protein [Micromonospora pisi]RKR85859.1 hypothetical protein BDK92_0070 [Micromonospora pisi]
MIDVSGDFEIHLTVEAAAADRTATFAEQHGLKYSHIVLDQALSPTQPMLTLSGRGGREAQAELARRWVRDLRAADLHVRRVKIEATPWSRGVPQTDSEAAADPPERYFEHHVKLLLPDAGGERLAAVTELVLPHHARLSRNARRHRTDGSEERFVTQRCHGVGQPTARARLDNLIAALRGAGHEVAEVEAEYVVSDSALDLDHGWLTSGGRDATPPPATRTA